LTFQFGFVTFDPDMPTRVERLDRLVFLSSVVTCFTEYSPEERSLSYNDVIKRVEKSDSSSFLIGDFSFFHLLNFIRVLNGKNPPKLDITLCSPRLSMKDPQETRSLLQLVLEEVENGYPHPLNGHFARETVLKALKTGSLILQVIPENLDAPQSVIINYGKFLPERQLFFVQRGNGKSWFFPIPFGLVNKYQQEQKSYRQKAVVVTP